MYFQPEATIAPKKGLISSCCAPTYDALDTVEESQLIIPQESGRHNSGARGLLSTGGIKAKTAADEVGISLGPVVGLVTDRRAKILFETDGPARVSISLKGRDFFSRKEHTVRAKVVTSNGRQPVTVEFTDLKPDYRYTICSSHKMYDLVDAHFRTLPCPETQAVSLLDGPIKIAVVSGNDVTYMTRCPLTNNETSFVKTYPCQTTDVSLWRDLYERIEDEKIHMVLHVGNNLQIGGVGQTLFKDMTDNAVSSQTAYELVQEEYRKVWNEPWLKHVLASCSNVMILAETDIGNLITHREETLNPEPETEDHIIDRTIALAALKGYHLYQQALWSGQGERHEHAKHIPLTRYLSLLLLDFTIAHTLEDTTFQSTSGMAEVEAAVHYTWRKKSEEDPAAQPEPPATPADVSPDKQIMKNSGDERAILVVSSSRICEPLSVAQHSLLADDLNAVLNILFDWKTSEAVGMREVAIVSAANRVSAFTHGTYTIRQRGQRATITEFAVGAMAVDTQRISLKPSWPFARTSFTRGNYTFVANSTARTPAYGMLTFGGKLGSTSEKSAEIRSQTFLIPRPTFWMETFSASQTIKPIIHGFGIFQEKLYVRRSALADTVLTSPSNPPPMRRPIVWKPKTF